MRPVAGTGADVASEPSKGTAGDANRLAVRGLAGQVAEVVGAGEQLRLPEAASIQGLVPPREGAAEAALVAQGHLEHPNVVAVPYQELGVLVDVGHVDLVEAHEILISVRGGRELARGRLAHQALDRADEGELARRRVLAPFVPDVRVGRACRRRGRRDCNGAV